MRGARERYLDNAASSFELPCKLGHDQFRERCNIVTQGVSCCHVGNDICQGCDQIVCQDHEIVCDSCDSHTCPYCPCACKSTDSSEDEWSAATKSLPNCALCNSISEVVCDWCHRLVCGLHHMKLSLSVQSSSSSSHEGGAVVKLDQGKYYVSCSDCSPEMKNAPRSGAVERNRTKVWKLGKRRQKELIEVKVLSALQTANRERQLVGAAPSGQPYTVSDARHVLANTQSSRYYGGCMNSLDVDNSVYQLDQVFSSQMIADQFKGFRSSSSSEDMRQAFRQVPLAPVSVDSESDADEAQSGPAVGAFGVTQCVRCERKATLVCFYHRDRLCDTHGKRCRNCSQESCVRIDCGCKCEGHTPATMHHKPKYDFLDSLPKNDRRLCKLCQAYGLPVRRSVHACRHCRAVICERHMVTEVLGIRMGVNIVLNGRLGRGRTCLDCHPFSRFLLTEGRQVSGRVRAPRELDPAAWLKELDVRQYGRHHRKCVICDLMISHDTCSLCGKQVCSHCFVVIIRRVPASKGRGKWERQAWCTQCAPPCEALTLLMQNNVSRTRRDDESRSITRQLDYVVEFGALGFSSRGVRRTRNAQHTFVREIPNPVQEFGYNVDPSFPDCLYQGCRNKREMQCPYGCETLKDSKWSRANTSEKFCEMHYKPARHNCPHKSLKKEAGKPYTTFLAEGASPDRELGWSETLPKPHYAVFTRVANPEGKWFYVCILASGLCPIEATELEVAILAAEAFTLTKSLSLVTVMGSLFSAITGWKFYQLADAVTEEASELVHAARIGIEDFGDELGAATSFAYQIFVTIAGAMTLVYYGFWLWQKRPMTQGERRAVGRSPSQMCRSPFAHAMMDSSKVIKKKELPCSAVSLVSGAASRSSRVPDWRHTMRAVASSFSANASSANPVGQSAWRRLIHWNASVDPRCERLPEEGVQVTPPTERFDSIPAIFPLTGLKIREALIAAAERETETLEMCCYTLDYRPLAVHLQSMGKSARIITDMQQLYHGASVGAGEVANALMSYGVRLRVHRGGDRGSRNSTMHMKMIIFGGAAVMLGSANFTHNSLDGNSVETAIITRSVAVVKANSELFESLWKESEAVDPGKLKPYPILVKEEGRGRFGYFIDVVNADPESTRRHWIGYDNTLGNEGYSFAGKWRLEELHEGRDASVLKALLEEQMPFELTCPVAELPRRHVEISRGPKKGAKSVKDFVVVYVVDCESLQNVSRVYGQRVRQDLWLADAGFKSAEEISCMIIASRVKPGGWLMDYLKQPVPIHRSWHNTPRDHEIAVSETQFGRPSSAGPSGLSAAGIPSARSFAGSGSARGSGGYPSLDPPFAAGSSASRHRITSKSSIAEAKVSDNRESRQGPSSAPSI